MGERSACKRDGTRRAHPLADPAPNTTLGVVKDDIAGLHRFWICAPWTVQRASSEKDDSPNARAIMRRESLKLRKSNLGRLIMNSYGSSAIHPTKPC